jgi:hypothetical protein
MVGITLLGSCQDALLFTGEVVVESASANIREFRNLVDHYVLVAIFEHQFAGGFHE